MYERSSLFYLVNVGEISKRHGAVLPLHFETRALEYFAVKCVAKLQSRRHIFYSHSVREGEKPLSASGLYTILIAVVAITLTSAFRRDPRREFRRASASVNFFLPHGNAIIR